MTHLFIINPTAGKVDRSASLGEEIRAVMEPRGEGYHIVATRHKGHATELVREAADCGAALRIYACGGDGTIGEVASGAAGLEHVEITQCPIGTGNDFLRMFGAHRDRFASIQTLVEGESRPLDLIECGDRYSINICSAGFDARIAGAVHRFKRIPLLRAKGAFNLSTVYNLFSGLHRPYRVAVDGVDLSGRYTMLVACNGRYYGGGFHPVPEADPTDGLIDFLLVRDVSRFDVAKVIGRYSAGRYRELSDIIRHIRGREMTVSVEGTPEAVNTDGEVRYENRFSFRLSERKVRLFAPAGSFSVFENENGSITEDSEE